MVKVLIIVVAKRPDRILPRPQDSPPIGNRMSAALLSRETGVILGGRFHNGEKRKYKEKVQGTCTVRYLS